jgi:hypothetical protein
MKTIHSTLGGLVAVLVFTLCWGTTGRLAAQPGARNFLFYNSANGEGAIGVIHGGKFSTTATFPPGAFARGWTHITDVPLSGGSMLFYNETTREGAVGTLTSSGFVTKKTYAAGAFGAWTHLVGMPSGQVLFYNVDTGAAAAGFDPTRRLYDRGAFATGWTHLAPSEPDRVLFYNASNGSGAIGFDPTRTVYQPGAFTVGWTHVVPSFSASGSSRLLFYKSSDRSGVLARLSNGALSTEKQFGPNAFGSWTHIAGYEDGFLFYDASSGAGAVAEIRGGSFITTMTYPAGAFGRWTHIVSAGR